MRRTVQLTTVDSSQLTDDVIVDRFDVALERSSVFCVDWDVVAVTLFFDVSDDVDDDDADVDAFLTLKVFALFATVDPKGIEKWFN